MSTRRVCDIKGCEEPSEFTIHHYRNGHFPFKIFDVCKKHADDLFVRGSGGYQLPKGMELDR